MDPTEIVEQRIYIGNLPNDVKMEHLTAVLPDGYDSSQLEVRHNYDIDRNITASYAFLNIQGTMSQIRTWCDRAAERSLAGHVLLIQFAKLTFLDRLRHEVNTQRRKKENTLSLLTSSFGSFEPRSDKGKSVKFGCDSSSSDDEEAMCVMKPGPAIEPDVRVVPVNERAGDKEAPSKEGSAAEIKRLESIKERSNAHVNQQKIIRMAIKTMSKGPSNKIVFHDSDSEIEKDPNELDIEDDTDELDIEDDDKKRKLFDNSDSDDEYDVDFSELKPKSKLIKTKVSSVDERFRMDSRFFDQDEERKVPDDDEQGVNEQGKLLEIADSIIGSDPNAKPKIKSKIDAEITMPTRFNPLEKKHQSLIIRKDDEIAEEEVSKKPMKVKPFKVEKGRFYEVTDNLKDQFKNPESTGFSLLGLFGGKDTNQTDDLPKQKTEIKDKPTENKSKIKNLKNPLDSVVNFFNIDEETEVEEVKTNTNAKGDQKMTSNAPLFIPLTDSRVEEALKFFNTPRKEPVPHSVLSRDLRLIVKRKFQRNAAKDQQFKTKLGNRRKFQNAKETDKKKKKKLNAA